MQAGSPQAPCSPKLSGAELAERLASLRLLTAKGGSLLEASAEEVACAPRAAETAPRGQPESLFLDGGAAEGPADWAVSCMSGFRALADAGFEPPPAQPASAKELRAERLRGRMQRLRELRAEATTLLKPTS